MISFLQRGGAQRGDRRRNIKGVMQQLSLTILLGYLITTGCTGTPGMKAPNRWRRKQI